MARRASRTDGNQQSIIDALRRMGYSVRDTSMVGQGFPDILVGGPRSISGTVIPYTWAFEIKDKTQPKHRHNLTDAQREFHAAWRGHIAKVFTLDDCLYEMGIRGE